MPQATDIEWTDFSSNPLKLRLKTSGKLVNACIPCSPGCKNCYAGRIVGRWWPKEEGNYPGYSLPLLKLGDWTLNDRELRHMLTFRPKAPFKHDGARPRVFVCDMTDLFGEWVPVEAIDQVVTAIALRPDVDWQVLTKRPDRMAEYLNAGDVGHRIYKQVSRWLDDGEKGILGRHWDAAHALAETQTAGGGGRFDWTKWKMPLVNAHLGTSVEDQKRADERIKHLLRCPAAVRFLSVEPLLGPVDLNVSRTVGAGAEEITADDDALGPPLGGVDGIDWVIVGGESGPGARPMHPDWARALRDQCQAAGVPFFFKQWGEWAPCLDNVDRHYRNGHPAIGDTNAQYNMALQRMIRHHGGSKLVDDRPEGWLPDMIDQGMGINGGGDDKLFLVNSGKKASGRMLDGREWNELSTPAEAING